MTVTDEFSHEVYNGSIWLTEAEVREDGTYHYVHYATGGTSLEVDRPYTFTAGDVGLWFYSGGEFGLDFYLKVIADDGAGQPAEPEPEPEPGSAAIPETGTAYSSTRTVQVDGKAVDFYAYALKDNDGNATDYFKLRDVAAILNGTGAQFQVGWNGAINITTGAAYTPNGSENIANFSGDQPYTVNVSPVRVDGVETALEAITLTDANGGGYTYFKLQDLGAALGFQVEESAEGGISIKTDKP